MKRVAKHMVGQPAPDDLAHPTRDDTLLCHMLFNSITFLLFLAVVLATGLWPATWRTRKAELLVASYVFYAAWNPPFVVLLWISTAVDWTAARRIAHYQRTAPRRLWLLASLVTNLGLLAYFKYGNFLLDNLRAVGLAAGDSTSLNIILPVGISFYTFQTLSYTIDVYRRTAVPWPSLLDFALYVTFFPQLVAGPIVRSGQFLPQCAIPRRATRAQLGWGLSLIVLGLFEKIVIADGLAAPVVDRVYGSAVTPTMLDAWCGTLAFSVQIFCDFAGYSTAAIGVALCLGFSLPDNFRFPYAAYGFSDFWHRWHISLSTWLRDYLYVPLGGNRHGRARTYIHLLVTMLIGGLWHGASWTFVVWGGLHGLYLAAERLVGRPSFAADRMSRAGRWAATLVTFAAVSFAWVFFRSASFSQAFEFSRAMFGLPAEGSTRMLSTAATATTLVLTLTMLIVHQGMRDRSIEAEAGRWPPWLRSLALSSMLVAIATMLGKERAFIYFQF